MRDGNERWARYVDILIARRYGGRQAAFARDLSVSPSTVSRWLGGSSPEIKHLRAISETSGVPLRELLAEAFQLAPDDFDGEAGGSGGSNGLVEASRPDDDFLALANAWPWLSDEDRASVRHLAQQIANQRRQSERRRSRKRDDAT